jgi:hypothetical protein
VLQANTCMTMDASLRGTRRSHGDRWGAHRGWLGDDEGDAWDGASGLEADLASSSRRRRPDGVADGGERRISEGLAGETNDDGEVGEWRRTSWWTFQVLQLTGKAPSRSERGRAPRPHGQACDAGDVQRGPSKKRG